MLRRMMLLALTLSRVSGAQTTALTHVNVVDVASGTIERDRTVIIEGATIASVSPSSSTRIPPAASVHDYRGNFVIPGLWDMHAHLGATGRSSLALYLANGVTGVRDMGSLQAEVRPWRDSIEAGTLLGPRLVMAGPIVERARWLAAVSEMARKTGDSALMRDMAQRIPVSTEADAVHAVDSIITLGGDFLKIRNDPGPAALYAMLRHARERRLPVAGHWPQNISPAAASDSGYRSLEHGPLSVVNGRLTPTLERMPADERRALFARFVRNGTAYTPTIVSLKGFRLTPDSVIGRLLADTAGRLEPRMRYMDAALLDGWRTDFDLKRQETGAPLDWAAFSRSWNRDLREMADAGVLLLAGTDAGTPLVYTGFALADELELLVREGGLTPLQSLRAATLNVAKWLGAESRFGTVAGGRSADLVVLEGDPLVDIANVRRIAAVVRGGRLLDRAELDRLLQGARRR